MINMSSAAVYFVLTNPENYKVFRNERSPSKRTVLFDDGIHQRVEIMSAGHWKFLRFSGSFPVHLLVEQNSTTKKVAFRLLSQNFMQVFEGSWSVQPLNANSSIVSLEQRIRLSFMPPRPLDLLFYRIVGRVASNVLRDLQAEAENIRLGRPTLDMPKFSSLSIALQQSNEKFRRKRS
mmetsp:Transcript_2997/g.5291  ORF Transcript_2997/g.5291 Transcript_2997/m.5291 type:complete len:178 (+) Transcript_2997:2-535(+)